MSVTAAAQSPSPVASLPAPHPTPHPINAAYHDWQSQSRLLERLNVVFVVGPPKSGTTWVQQTLAWHPHAAVEGEGHFATRLAHPMAAQFLSLIHISEPTRPY